MKVRIEEMRSRAIEAEAEVPKAMAQEFRYGNPDIYLNIGRMKMKNLDDKKRCYRGGYNHPSVIVTHALLTPSCLANSALVQLFSFISREYLFRRSSLVSLEGLTVDDKKKV